MEHRLRTFAATAGFNVSMSDGVTVFPQTETHTSRVPINPSLQVPDVLRDRGVTEAVYEQYLSDVHAAFEALTGSPEP